MCLNEKFERFSPLDSSIGEIENCEKKKLVDEDSNHDPAQLSRHLNNCARQAESRPRMLISW